MKKTALRISSVMGLAILILMAGISAKAQNQYRAYIPFNFTIGQKSYEPGDYVVDTLSSDTAHKVVVIRDAEGRNLYLKRGMAGEGYSNDKVANLVFNRYEAQYSLAAIRTPSFIVRFSRSKAKERLTQNQEMQRTIVALTKK